MAAMKVAMKAAKAKAKKVPMKAVKAKAKKVPMKTVKAKATKQVAKAMNAKAAKAAKASKKAKKAQTAKIAPVKGAADDPVASAPVKGAAMSTMKDMVKDPVEDSAMIDKAAAAATPAAQVQVHYHCRECDLDYPGWPFRSCPRCWNPSSSDEDSSDDDDDDDAGGNVDGANPVRSAAMKAIEQMRYKKEIEEMRADALRLAAPRRPPFRLRG